MTLLGLADPDFLTTSYGEGTDTKQVQEWLNKWEPIPGYRILLSHRPELFNLYEDSGIDLVFSGHSHGGQIRLPLIGGLIAPDQGWLPKYDGGVFQERNTTMVVSRGLGNSVMPLRLFNRPEIVEVVLHREEIQ